MKFPRLTLVAVLIFCLAVGAGATNYTAYKQSYGDRNWHTKLNNFIDAVAADLDAAVSSLSATMTNNFNTLSGYITTLSDLVTNWATTENYLIYVPQAPTHVDGDTMTFAGDLTAEFPAGRIVHAYCGADGMKYSTVAASIHAAGTTTVDLDDSVLTANLAHVFIVASRDGLSIAQSGQVHAADYGTPSRATLAAAIAAIGASDRTLVVGPGTWSITSDITIPANIALSPRVGALFDISTGVTLDVQGPVKAEATKWLARTGTGSVLWQNGQAFLAAWCGVVADGATECNAEFTFAAEVAAAGNVDLVLPAGTLVCNPTTAISLAGIPRVRCDGGEVVIDSSSVGISPVFTCYGTKTEIADALTITAGDTTVAVDAGTYNQGDIILIASDDSVANTYREPTQYYCKGGRHTVQGYSAPTLTFGPPATYGYTNAYVYTISEARLIIGREVTFRGNTAYYGRGLIVRFASADIAANFENYRLGGMIYQDSRGTFSGKIRNHYVALDNGYGLCVHDLSHVDIVGADIRNCRHCVTGGGGAFWSKTDFGGAAASVSFPGSYNINGGFFENTDTNNAGATSLAVECHGNMRSMVISGATIRGGVGMSAEIGKIDGCNITFQRRYGLHLGPDNNSTSWGNYTISDTRIECDGTAVSGTSQTAIVMDSIGVAQKILLRDVTVDKSPNTDDTTFVSIGGNCSDLQFINCNFDAHPGTGASPVNARVIINQKGYLRFTGNKLTYAGVAITPYAYDINADIERNVVYLAGGIGISVPTATTEATTNGGFTSDLTGWAGANWAWEAGADGQARHTAGATTGLTQSITVTTGAPYLVVFTITGRTAGSVAVTIGSASVSGTFNANTTYTRTVLATGSSGSQTLSITPTSDFDGAITSIAVGLMAGSYANLNMRGNEAYKCQTYGLYITAKADSINLTESIFRNNNQSSASSIAGAYVYLDDLAGRLYLANNDCQDTQTSVTQVYGFRVNASVQCAADLYLYNNNGDGCTSGNLIASGTSMTKRAQIGNRATAGTQLRDGIMDSSGAFWAISTGGAVEAF